MLAPLIQLMRTGLDEWVDKMDSFSQEASNHLARVAQGTFPVAPPSSAQPQEFSLDIFASEEARITQEANILHRLVSRRKQLLIQDILTNLELAAYYLLVLLNASELFYSFRYHDSPFISMISPPPKQCSRTTRTAAVECWQS